MQISGKRALEHRSRGDTMVEVLIAITVVATILGGAYVTTNRSLQATRAAEERSIALKLAESQIERIKGLMTTATGVGAVQGVSSPFCIVPTGLGVPTPVGSGSVCHFNAGGVNNNATEPVFRVSIAKPSANNYTLTVQWDNIRGQGQDSL